MHVTKWGEYGILCSVFLARRYLAALGSADAAKSDADCGPVGAAEVAQEQGIPAQYTQQILQRLRRGGVVASVRGARGGYVLSRHPKDITLLDIMTAAEGSTFDVMCETSPAYPRETASKECAGGNGSCNLKDVWFEVRNAIDAVLTRRTLESLVASGSSDGVSKLVQIQSARIALSAGESGKPVE
jgi:Rrf2 family cysteine metabolism transcriptional repressor